MQIKLHSYYNGNEKNTLRRCGRFCFWIFFRCRVFSNGAMAHACHSSHLQDAKALKENKHGFCTTHAVSAAAKATKRGKNTLEMARKRLALLTFCDVDLITKPMIFLPCIGSSCTPFKYSSCSNLLSLLRKASSSRFVSLNGLAEAQRKVEAMISKGWAILRLVLLLWSWQVIMSHRRRYWLIFTLFY